MPAHAHTDSFTVDDELLDVAAEQPVDDEVELIAHPVESPEADKEAFIAAVGAAIADAAEEQKAASRFSLGRWLKDKLKIKPSDASEKAAPAAGRHAAADAVSYEEPEQEVAASTLKTSRAGGRHGVVRTPEASETPEAPAEADAETPVGAVAETPAEASVEAVAEAPVETPEEPIAEASANAAEEPIAEASADTAAPAPAEASTALAVAEAPETPTAMEPVPEPAPELPLSVRVRKAKQLRIRRTRIARISVAAALVAALGAVYAYGVHHFSDHVRPNVTVAGTDLSGMEVSEAKAALDARAASYKCSISGNDYYLLVRGEDIDYSVDTQSLVDRIMSDFNRFLWPFLLGGSHTYDFEGICSWNEEKLEAVLAAYTEPHNEGVTQPCDAYVAYSPPDKRFVVVPEVEGNVYRLDDVVSQTRASLSRLELHVDLAEEALVVPTLYRDNEDLIEDAETCNSYLGADFYLVINLEDRWSKPGRVLDHIDGSMLAQWIHLDNGEVFFDEAAMREWCWQYAKSHYTYQTDRTYTRPDGATFTVSGGTYGWKYDIDNLYQVLVRCILNGVTGRVVIPMSQSAAVWVDADNPLDFGNTYIDITISRQIVRYIVDGVEVWQAPTVSGDIRSGQGTPYGAYYIVYKLHPTHLKGINPDGSTYDVPVDWWMSFIGNDYGLHDNPLRYAFGLPWAFRDAGSHGCCNLPYDKAKSLYAMTVLGTPVLIHW